MGQPEYLYHYTSIESLAMILSTKTIRFSPLNVLDDIQEDKVSDQWKVGKYTFISSWTAEANESIPMWKMYSDIKSGVRIKLPNTPFKRYNITSEGLGPEYEIEPFQAIVPRDVIINDEYSLANYQVNQLLKQVHYTDDQERIVPSVLRMSEMGTYLSFDDVGTSKKTCWEFQKEWRYILRFLPLSVTEMNREGYQVGLNLALQRIQDVSHTLSFSYFYLNIADDAFDKMEITLSPQITPGNREIIYALRDKFNKKIKISDSKLANEIRY